MSKLQATTTTTIHDRRSPQPRSRSQPCLPLAALCSISHAVAPPSASACHVVCPEFPGRCVWSQISRSFYQNSKSRAHISYWRMRHPQALVHVAQLHLFYFALTSHLRQHAENLDRGRPSVSVFRCQSPIGFQSHDRTCRACSLRDHASAHTERTSRNL